MTCWKQNKPSADVTCRGNGTEWREYMNTNQNIKIKWLWSNWRQWHTRMLHVLKRSHCFVTWHVFFFFFLSTLLSNKVCLCSRSDNKVVWKPDNARARWKISNRWNSSRTRINNNARNVNQTLNRTVLQEMEFHNAKTFLKSIVCI